MTTTETQDATQDVAHLADRAIITRGPLVIWENENGFAYAWGRIPAEGEAGDGGDFDTVAELLAHVAGAPHA